VSGAICGAGEVGRLWTAFHERIVAEGADFEIKDGVEVMAVVSELRGIFDSLCAAVRQQARDERDREILAILPRRYSQATRALTNQVLRTVQQMGYEPCETCGGKGERETRPLGKAPADSVFVDPDEDGNEIILTPCPDCTDGWKKRSEG
tara:strand:+ start:69 stop:518 length:450 start_codon:yes stop_codon:yes gene_type:complete